MSQTDYRLIVTAITVDKYFIKPLLILVFASHNKLTSF